MKKSCSAADVVEVDLVVVLGSSKSYQTDDYFIVS